MAQAPIQNSNLRLLSTANSVLDQVLALLKTTGTTSGILSSLTITGTLTVEGNLVAAVGGDLSGSLPNPTVSGLQGTPVTTLSPSTGNVLAWNGSAWAATGVESANILPNIAALRNAPIPPIPFTNFSYHVLGFATYGDGGDGFFTWTGTNPAGGTLDDNVGIVITSNLTATGRWVRTGFKQNASGAPFNYTREVNARWFGVVGDGVTDDSPAFKNALIAVNTLASNINEVASTATGANPAQVALAIPAGVYNLGATLELNTYSCLKGEEGTVLQTSAEIPLLRISPYFVRVEKINFRGGLNSIAIGGYGTYYGHYLLGNGPAQGCYPCEIDFCHFSYPSGPAIWEDQAPNTVLTTAVSFPISGANIFVGSNTDIGPGPATMVVQDSVTGDWHSVTFTGVSGSTEFTGCTCADTGTSNIGAPVSIAYTARGEQGAISVTNFWFEGACLWWGSSDTLKFNTGQINWDFTPGPLQPLDTLGVPLGIWNSTDDLHLSNITAFGTSGSAARAAMICGNATVKLNFVIFGQTDALTLVRTRAKLNTYQNGSSNTPMPLPVNDIPLMLDVDNCDLTCCFEAFWLEIYEYFPSSIRLKNLANQLPYDFSNTYGIWVDQGVTWPILTTNNGVSSFILDYDTPRDIKGTTGTPFSFYQSFDPGPNTMPTVAMSNDISSQMEPFTSLSNREHDLTTQSVYQENLILYGATDNTSSLSSTGLFIAAPAGQNLASLPSNTLTVSSTALYPSSGKISVTTTAGVQTVTYTSKTATTFTGCSGGTGTTITVSGGNVNPSTLISPQDTSTGIALTGISGATQWGWGLVDGNVGMGTQNLLSGVYCFSIYVKVNYPTELSITISNGSYNGSSAVRRIEASDTFQRIEVPFYYYSGATLSLGMRSAGTAATAITAWVNGPYYSIGDRVVNTDSPGKVYIATTAGVSTTMPTGTGSGINGGGVTWNYVSDGAAFLSHTNIGMWMINKGHRAAPFTFPQNADSAATLGWIPRTYYGTAAPTSGTYFVGDTCINTDPTTSSVSGWVCTTAGTPGTWSVISTIGGLPSGTTGQMFIYNGSNWAGSNTTANELNLTNAGTALNITNNAVIGGELQSTVVVATDVEMTNLSSPGNMNISFPAASSLVINYGSTTQMQFDGTNIYVDNPIVQDVSGPLVLQGNGTGSGPGIVFDNTGPITAGKAFSLRSGGTEFADFDYKGSYAIQKASTALTLTGNVSASGGPGWILDNATAATIGKVGSFRSGGVEVAYVDYKGTLWAGANQTYPIDISGVAATIGIGASTLTLSSDSTAGIGSFISQSTVARNAGVGIHSFFNSTNNVATIGVGGSATSSFISANHYIGSGSAPVVTISSNWGASGSVVVIGTDYGFLVQITAAGGSYGPLGGGTWFNVTLANGYSNANYSIQVSPASGQSAALINGQLYAVVISATQFEIFSSGGMGGTPSASSLYYFQINTTGAGASY